MKTFSGDNFSIIYYDMLQFAINDNSQFINSRLGSVKDLGPAYFEIDFDSFRLPVLQKRAINPFFALTEFSWIIMGKNNLQPLNFFVKDYSKYSDDNQTLNGAYGYRLRAYFGKDQISDAIQELKQNPYTRRVVLNMWSVDDLLSDSKDLPCNISLMPKIRDGKLDLTVVNRSNDLYLGVPYNVFVFYLLQQYMAFNIGCQVGVQRHFSDSLHIYKRDFSKAEEIIKHNSIISINKIYDSVPLFHIRDYIHENHTRILKQEYGLLSRDSFLQLFKSYQLFKLEHYEEVLHSLPHNILGLTAYLWFKQRNVNFSSSYFDQILK